MKLSHALFGAPNAWLRPNTFPLFERIHRKDTCFPNFSPPPATPASDGCPAPMT